MSKWNLKKPVFFNKKKADVEPMTEETLPKLKFTFRISLLLLGVLVYAVISLVFVFALDVLPVFKIPFEQEGNRLAKQQLTLESEHLHNLLEGQRNALLSQVKLLAGAAQTTALLNTPSSSLTRGYITYCNSMASDVSLDFLYLIDNRDRVRFTMTTRSFSGSELRRHPLVEECLNKGEQAAYRLEPLEWLKNAGFSHRFIDSSVDSSRQKAGLSTEKDNESLVLEAAVPIMRDGSFKGFILAGVVLARNVGFVRKLQRLSESSLSRDSFISLLSHRGREVTTLTTKTAYNTEAIPQGVIHTAYQKERAVIKPFIYLSKRYLISYSPMRNWKGQVVGLVEYGFPYQALVHSYPGLLRAVKMRIYLIIAIITLLTMVAGRLTVNFLSNRIFRPLEASTTKISQLIEKIREASTKIRKYSSEILASSEEQAAYFSEQAASINETTATMEELATVTKQIANYAEQVVTIAQQTTENAEKGYSSVQETVLSIKEIKMKNETSTQEIVSLGERSQQIGQVMRFITSIASQTKLIAFNASIEASAAGDVGKRFGVVATEVRRLAENVVQSTDKIKKIITEIQKSTNRLVFVSEEETKKVDEGVVLSENSGDALQEIMKIVTKTNQAAKQISLITQQQRTASDQVVSALRDISQGASESVKLSKNIANAMSEMDELSRDLENLVETSAQVMK